MCVFESGEMIKIRIKIDGWGPIWAGEKAEGREQEIDIIITREKCRGLYVRVQYYHGTAASFRPWRPPSFE